MRGRRLAHAGSAAALVAAFLTWAVPSPSVAAGATIVVNPALPSSGVAESPAISGDGNFVTFTAQGVAPGDVGIGIRDVAAHLVDRIDKTPSGTAPDGTASTSAVSDDGRWVAFASSASNLVNPPLTQAGRSHVYLRDRSASSTIRIDGDGEANRPSISTDGRYVVFDSTGQLLPADGDNGWDVYRYDRLTATLELVSADGSTDENAVFPSVSGDGQRVAFSAAGSLVPEDTNGRFDVYVRNMATTGFGLVSAASGGGAANGDSGYTNADVAISRDGAHVVFGSNASDLVAGDTNNTFDIFLASAAGIQRVSVPPGGGQFGDFSTGPSVTEHGEVVVFGARSTYGAQPYVYARDVATGVTTLVSSDLAGNPVVAGDRATATSATGRFVAYTETATSPFNLLLTDRQYVAPPPGHVEGALTVNGRAPLGSESTVGVRACPGTWDLACLNGVGGTVNYSADYSASWYTIDLDPSLTYTLRPYIRGGLVLGAPVTAGPSSSSVADLAVNYGTVTGHLYSDVASVGVRACASPGGCAVRDVRVPPTPLGSQDFALPLAAGESYAVRAYDTNNTATEGPSQLVTVSAGQQLTQDLFLSASAAPEPAGDVNNDGMQDSLQANVASAPTTDGSGALAVAAPAGTVVTDLTVTPASSAPAPPPAGYVLADNLISFKIPSEVGGSRQVVISFTQDIAPGTDYLKYTPALGWHAVGTVDATARTVTLTLTDGDPATDADGVADGVISDPGALAVRSTVTGLFSPIDMGTTVNVAKAGSTVPVKWRVLRGGVPVSAATQAFTSLTSTLGDCGTGPADSIETYSGASGLQYLGDGYWQYNWKTPTGYAGSCRALVLTTPAGSLTAQFRFR